MAEVEGMGTVDPSVEAMWRMVLTEGHRHWLAVLPAAIKCVACHIPLAGFTGQLVTLTTGLRVSRKNPYMCNL